MQIVSDDQAAHGVYMLQFYKHGCWQRVLIDNYLPCIEGEDRLAFACSGHVGELWPSFLEKGYAKVRQSVAALREGAASCQGPAGATGTQHTMPGHGQGHCPCQRPLQKGQACWGRTLQSKISMQKGLSRRYDASASRHADMLGTTYSPWHCQL